jgi:fatty acid desaturase
LTDAAPQDLKKLEREGSLKPVIDVIPDEAYRNPTWRGLSYFARDLAFYVGMAALLVFVTNPLLVLPIEIVMVLAVTGLFVVAHDCAHGALFNSKRKNTVIGKLAMLPSPRRVTSHGCCTASSGAGWEPDCITSSRCGGTR